MKLGKTQKHLFLLVAISLISTLIVWLPFSFRNQMTKVFANFDGPNYIIIAKCGYNPDCIRTKFSLPLPLEYYPAHFPGYPLMIKAFDFFLPGWWAMIATNLVFSSLMISAFYLLLKQLKVKKRFWLSLVLLFLPARNLVLRSVGAPEAMFIFSILGSIYFYRKKKYWLSGLFLGLGQMTKTPAVLLLGAYGVETLINQIIKKKARLGKVIVNKLPLIIGPLVILPIFYLYLQQTGDFFAYFNSGDNFHLVIPPFQTFISSRSWLGDFWLEDIVYIYLLGGLAISYLYKKYKTDIITLFPAVFYIATLFVAHRDISRYSAPLYPFWILGFSKLIKTKEFKYVFLLLLPAIFLFAYNFINYNIAPIADWAPYY
jgi:hypothetical protein